MHLVRWRVQLDRNETVPIPWNVTDKRQPEQKTSFFMHFFRKLIILPFFFFFFSFHFRLFLFCVPLIYARSSSFSLLLTIHFLQRLRQRCRQCRSSCPSQYRMRGRGQRTSVQIGVHSRQYGGVFQKLLVSRRHVISRRQNRRGT